MTTCESVQTLLAVEGASALDREPEARCHVDGCEACARVARELRALDTALRALPAEDAPAALSDRILRALDGQPPAAGPQVQEAPTRRVGDHPGWSRALAACVVLVACYWLAFTGFDFDPLIREQHAFERGIGPPDRPWSESFYSFSRGDASLSRPDTETGMVARLEQETNGLRRGLSEDRSGPRANETAAEATMPQAQREIVVARRALPASPSQADAARKEQSAPLTARDALAQMRVLGLAGVPAPAARDQALTRSGERQDAPRSGVVAAAPASPAPTPAMPGKAADLLALAPQVMRGNLAPADVDGQVGGGVGDKRKSPAPHAETDAIAGRRVEAKNEPLASAGAFADDARSGAAASPAMTAVVLPPGGTAGDALAQARAWLAARERLDGVAFQPATGYWTNTYIPGDPSVRLLAARVQRWQRHALTASLPEAALERTARPNWQPFDPPGYAALTAYLHADRRAISGPSRLRVQVGLKASERGGGHRPAMNVGVVLDLREPVGVATGARIRALVEALERARQPGDRIALLAAGPGGGLLVEPGRFRHGPLRLTLERVLGDAAVTPLAPLGLSEAIRLASDTVREGDDPESVLGASLVLLVSTAPIGDEAGFIETLAHANAVAGIAMSAVPLGARADVDALDRIVLAGQGHRRALESPDDAAALVDDELHAASRAVARAVRLRIRLAPGVQLIRVIGAERLAAPAAQRVRDAERSIDQRLSRNLGIQADRGDDEEGIQMVIPSFFAGDAHVVLLDVVADRPGRIADLTVRFKDLLTLGNGVTRTSLSLEDGEQAPGPLEYNVVKNELAHELAQAATDASRQLARGDRAAALATLRSVRDLLVGMRQAVPAWEFDPELRNDESMLAGYLAALDAPMARSARGLSGLASSLDYAAVRRLVPVRDE